MYQHLSAPDDARFDAEQGMTIERRFTAAGEDPFAKFNFVLRDASIVKMDGTVVFEQSDIEVPDMWPQTTVNIMADKYFRKAGVPEHPLVDGAYDLDTILDGEPGRERSAKQTIYRLANAWALGAMRGGYLASFDDALALRDETAFMLMGLYAAPNSPQWFNTGLHEAYGLEGGKARHFYFNEATREVLESPYRYHRTAASACYIVSVEDTLNGEDGVADFIASEMAIFKDGGGSGANLSRLRAAGEPLSSGGATSGALSWAKIADTNAGAVKSGGSTRRAAKMVIFDADHPDVRDFIWVKAQEERKAKALIAAGYDPRYDGEAYASVAFQNGNNSVRFDNAFMAALEVDGNHDLVRRTDGEVAETLKARELWREVAEAAWECADPGVQFSSTINEWHTAPNWGPIRGSNPCFTGDTLVHTDRGLVRFDEIIARTSNGETFQVYTHDATNADAPATAVELTTPEAVMVTGTNPIVRLEFTNGMAVRCTPNHRFWTQNRGWVRADELADDDEIQILDVEAPAVAADYSLPVSTTTADYISQCGRGTIVDTVLPEKWTLELAHYLGWLVGDGSVNQTDVTVTVYGTDAEQREIMPVHAELIKTITGSEPTPVAMSNGTVQLRVYRKSLARMLVALGFSNTTAAHKQVPWSVLQAPDDIVAAFLRGLFDADGTVVSQDNGTRYVGLGSCSKELLRDVQRLLSARKTFSRIYDTNEASEEGSFSYVRNDGSEVTYARSAMSDLRITAKSIERYATLIGFSHPDKAAKLASLINDHVRYDTANTVRLASRSDDGTETTYNLCEPRNHSYVVNGLVVSNCSEYLFLDNSACNLASMNLLRFYDVDNQVFDIEAYEHAIRVLTLVLEVTVAEAHYPTEKVAEMSYKARTLGLGYCNLGSLLMHNALAYDSDEGRALAGALTSVMNSTAYATSAEMAEVVGPCEAYADNAEPMARVLRNHAAAARGLDGLHNYDGLSVAPVPLDRELLETLGFDDLATAAARAAEKMLAGIERAGFRNMQATLLAPTGTIGLLMAADTTGVEPGFSLVAFKKLAGGGDMIIANESVWPALKKLGYTDAQADDICAYITDNFTIEGAPHLADEHLPIFDCAVEGGSGVRSIAPGGHVRMLGAATPHLSGAISKTVNLPESATVADIEAVHQLAYDLGVKCVAIYRNNSKGSQPLNTSADDKPEAEDVLEAVRLPEAGESPTAFYGGEQTPKFRLPPRRAGLTFKANVGGTELLLRTGEYPDGTLGEVFIDLSKEGSTLKGVLSCFSIAVSKGLQRGVPLEEYVDTFTFHTFEPRGMVTGDDNVKMANSIIDFVFRKLAYEYLGRADLVQVPYATDPISPAAAMSQVADGTAATPVVVETAAPAEAATEQVAEGDDSAAGLQTTGELCRSCDGPMVPNGSCLRCSVCGETTGCS